MDARELAQAMLDWADAKERLDIIEQGIKEAVLALAKTQTVGNVRASFSEGRRSYRYEDAALDHRVGSDIIELFTTTVVDWKKVCDEAGIEKDDIPFDQVRGPSVTLKLLE